MLVSPTDFTYLYPQTIWSSWFDQYDDSDSGQICGTFSENSFQRILLKQICIFLFKYHLNLLAMVQLTIDEYWFKWS